MLLKKSTNMLANGNIAPPRTVTTQLRIELQQGAAIPNDDEIKTGLSNVQGICDTNDHIHGHLGNILVIDLGSLCDIVTIITFATLTPIGAYDLLTYTDDAQIAPDRQIFLNIDDIVVAIINIESARPYQGDPTPMDLPTTLAIKRKVKMLSTS